MNQVKSGQFWINGWNLGVDYTGCGYFLVYVSMVWGEWHWSFNLYDGHSEIMKYGLVSLSGIQ